MNRVRNDEPWPDTVRTGGQQRGAREAVSREELLAPATQVVADRDAYLGQGQHDVGRRISDDQVELFVTGDAAPSLQRELELHASEFIAVHDLGASASLRLLNGLAGAAQAMVQKLTIRRQGYGLALAVLQFVEVPLAAGGAVRVYSTEASADGPTRQALARTLLAHSRLGVLIAGEVPAHAVAAALQPLREAITRGPWTNQELLIVPLGSSGALATQAAALSAGTSVAVQVTPQAVRPKHIWNFIAGVWNRLNGASGSARSVEADIERAVPKPPTPRSEATTQPGNLPQSFAPTVQAGLAPAAVASSAPAAAAPASHGHVSPMPLPPTRPMPIAGGTSWQDYVERCMAIKGTVGCCVFDIHGAKPLAHAGVAPSAERLAHQGANLLSAALDGSRALGLGSTQPEMTLSTSGHHLIVRPIPGHPGIAVHLVLLASAGNLTLARMQLERVEAPL
ncbi:MAG: hypothetical protein IPM15_08085 [Betaproteobacteria bacterium]|nr:hypothetical protein [Betaproteobacteria bacterium]